VKKSKPIKVDEVLQLYKEQLNRHDSAKDFFTKEEIHLLIEHEESLRAKIMELGAENARLKRFAEKIRDDEVEYYISACDGDTTWKAVARMWADQALKGGE